MFVCFFVEMVSHLCIMFGEVFGCSGDSDP